MSLHITSYSSSSGTFSVQRSIDLLTCKGLTHRNMQSARLICGLELSL